jgi:hypothetical protein
MSLEDGQGWWGHHSLQLETRGPLQGRKLSASAWLELPQELQGEPHNPPFIARGGEESPTRCRART